MAVKLSVKKSELSEGKPVGVDVNGKRIMLVVIGGNIYAIDGVCSHRGGPLEKGVLDGYMIKCPWHEAMYDVRTGEGSPETPWGTGQKAYNIKSDENGDLWIDA